MPKLNAGYSKKPYLHFACATPLGGTTCVPPYARRLSERWPGLVIHPQLVPWVHCSVVQRVFAAL